MKFTTPPSADVENQWMCTSSPSVYLYGIAGTLLPFRLNSFNVLIAAVPAPMLFQVPVRLLIVLCCSQNDSAGVARSVLRHSLSNPLRCLVSGGNRCRWKADMPVTHRCHFCCYKLEKVGPCILAALLLTCVSCILLSKPV